MSVKQSRHCLNVDLQNLRLDPAHSAAASALAIAGQDCVGKVQKPSEQERYYEILMSSKIKLAPVKKMKEFLEDASNKSYDPIENAIKRFPLLTREKAEEMAKAYGF